MTRNTEREDFLTDYDPNWSSADEREWSDADEPGYDPGPERDWGKNDYPEDRDYGW